MDIEKQKVALDIYDLCSILSTAGFVVVDEERSKQHRNNGRSIAITCNVSGKKVYLESTSGECLCWRHAMHDDAEKWEMSGTSGGVQTIKTESSITSWKELPKNSINFIEKTVESLVETVRGGNTKSSSFIERKSSFSFVDEKLNKIKSNCNLSMEDPPAQIFKSSFMINELHQADTEMVAKDDTTNMYRSLDTLAALPSDPVLPQPGALNEIKKVTGMIRQNTYSVDEVPRETFPARTSSPVPSFAKSTFKKLSKAERLSNDLINIIQETMKMIEEETAYPGLSPYTEINVSKISQPTGGDSVISGNNLSMKSTQQYVSSPNLSSKHESRIPSSNLKRGKSVSTYRVNSLNIPTKTASSLTKTSSLKRSVPKKTSSIASPTFGNGRKSLGGTSVSGNQLPGIYRSISDRLSLGGSTKETELKKKTGLYSHIKPTIQRYTSIKK